MTYAEIASMIAGTGLPNAYYAFPIDPDNPAPDPPFITFYYSADADLLADNGNYVHVVVLTLELYTDNKDFGSEFAIETALRGAGLAWDRTETWVDSERMFQTTYTTEIIITESDNNE